MDEKSRLEIGDHRLRFIFSENRSVGRRSATETAPFSCFMEPRRGHGDFSPNIPSLLGEFFRLKPSPCSIFLRDRRGATLVTYVLVLPLFLLLIFGVATLWRIISIKQSLDVVTYEATRYLSNEGQRISARALPYYNPDGWAQIAYDEIEPWMQEQIRRNPFIEAGDVIQVEIIPPLDVDCNPWGAAGRTDSRAPENIRFTVTTRLWIQTPIKVPFIGPPFTFTLQESHSDLVECTTYDWSLPDEGAIFLQRNRP